MAATANPSDPELEDRHNPAQEEYEKLTSRYNPDRKDNQAAGNPTDPRGNDTAAGDATDPRGASSSAKLKDREEAGDSPSFYKKPEEAGASLDGQLGKKGKWGSGKNRPGGWRGRVFNRRTAAGGGILGIIIAAAFGFSIIQGPAEIVQAAHMFMKNSAKSDSDSSNRIGRLFRYARAVKNADFGETRVGTLGSSLFGKTIEQLGDIGVTFDRNTTGVTTKTNINMDKLKAAYPEVEGMNHDEKISFLSDKLGVAPEQISGSGTKFVVDQTDLDIKASRLLTKNTVGLLDDGKIIGGMKYRVMTKFFNLPSLFHPFKRALADKENKIANGRARQQAENEDERQRVANETAPIEAKGEAAAKGIKASKFGKRAVLGALTLTGSACMVYDTAGLIVAVNRDIVYLPAAIRATDIMAAGAQIESGQDISLSQIRPLEEGFTDTKGGTIWQAQAMQALANGGKIDPNLPDMPADYRQVFSDRSTAQNIKGTVDSLIKKVYPLGAGGIFGACSTFGTLAQISIAAFISVAGAFSEALTAGADTPLVAAGVAGTVAAKEAINATVSGLAFHFVQKLIVSKASIKLAADAFSGPVGGNLLAYGSRAAANIAAVASGGIALSQAEATTFATQQHLQDRQQFNSEPIAKRLFDPYDSRSVAGKLIDNVSTSPSQNIAKMGSLFTNFGSMFAHAFSVFSPHAQAATTAYNWGFPQYGIPNALLNDPQLADPYANAGQVAELLDSGDGDYISRAKACFGVDISNDNADQVWDVTPVSQVFPEDGSNNKCNDISDENWRRIIMFVFDTSTMKAAACYQGDDQSCSDLGMGSSSDTSTTTGTAVSGSVQQLAQQILDNSNVSYPLDASSPNGSTRTVLQALASGQQAPVYCANAGVTSTNMDPAVLQFVLDLAGQTKIGINALTDKCHVANSNHYQGKAVDFECKSIPFDISLADSIAQKYGLSRNSETCSADSHWHYSTNGR